ncbi:LCI fold-containing protein [Bacillus thuringiensis]|uniref:LCI fold-containing protein n=1 Tax=Bacillus thuringiensis TaxID=1428 RepID=UPI0011A5C5BB|nr:LCI fold-containing protein [Bacillus thuringiensis]
MFKKLVVGALATGIALTGGVAASASTEGVDSTKQVAPTKALLAEYYNYEYKFVYHDVSGQNIYRTYEFHSPDGYFANSFYSEGKTWYFKGIAGYDGNGGAYGHYEARK